MHDLALLGRRETLANHRQHQLFFFLQVIVLRNLERHDVPKQAAARARRHRLELALPHRTPDRCHPVG